VSSIKTTQLCPDGEYRPEWTVPAQASSCVPCGEGISAEKTEQITLYDIANETIKKVLNVAGSVAGCCECRVGLGPEGGRRMGRVHLSLVGTG
jgi:hypothetical protein